jgi:hypothetical protein
MKNAKNAKETNKQFFASVWMSISPWYHHKNHLEGMADPMHGEMTMQTASFFNLQFAEQLP